MRRTTRKEERRYACRRVLYWNVVSESTVSAGERSGMWGDVDMVTNEE